MTKNSIRIENERINKIYLILDKALNNSGLKIQGAELLAAMYQLLKNKELANIQQRQEKMEHKK
jgi:hypothetical protein